MYDTGTPYWQPYAPDDDSVNPTSAIRNRSISGKWTTTDTLLSDAAAMFTSVGGHLVENPIWAGFLEAASIAFDQIQPTSQNYTVGFNAAFVDPMSSFPDGPPADFSDATMEKYTMDTPEVLIRYEPRFYDGDAYDVHGRVQGAAGIAYQQDAKQIGFDSVGTFHLGSSLSM